MCFPAFRVVMLCCLVGNGLIAAVRAQEPDDGYRPLVGQRHQEFKLPNIVTREKVHLSDFRGRKVLLIHFASW